MVFSKINEEKQISLLTTAASMGTAMLMRNLIDSGWKKMNSGNPPKNPADRETSWKEAIMWTIGTAIVLGLAKMVSRKLAVEGYDKMKKKKKLKF